ncbi:ABC transporter ATP-binding protein [Paenibacillus thermotolerans]|uniref:ABC transporter ATP-binding protein n=1 Tax=Paenibacillus thermotolerans TaxID=3027807 RepID=UPI0023674E73|nr:MULTISPECIES: ABC transporter ATP-binding protein [unclassified Paenibacillus]
MNTHQLILTADLQSVGYEAGEPAVRGIRFEVSSGEMLGLIGPNGAGKSTTIKAIMGLLKHVDGSVRFHGPKQTYAYVPEHPILYEDLTLWEHVTFAASVMPSQSESGMALERAERLLSLFRLGDVRHHLPGSFSKGMQQKLMLVLAFMQQPDLYIVDEPFIGLDPRATKQLLALLAEERSRGAGIIMSTHVLDTAEKICSTFLLVNEGTAKASGDLRQIRTLAGMPDASLLDCFDALT